MRPAQQKTIALDQTWSQPQPTIASHANPNGIRFGPLK